MMARRIIEPSQLRKRKRRRRIFKIALWVVLFLLVIFGSAYITHIDAVTIKNINISGNDATPESDLVGFVNDDISGNYFHLFSKRNIFLYPKEKVQSDILEKYKRIKTLSIHQGDLQSINISMEERKPNSLWCKEEPTTSCYFLDENGYVFSQSSEISGNLYFVYYGLITDNDPVGQNYLSPDLFKQLSSFAERVKGLGIQANSIVALDNQDFELHLENGGKILFTSTVPLDKTLANLETVTDESNPKDTQVDLSKIDYLDLRFGNKVFYRYNP